MNPVVDEPGDSPLQAAIRRRRMVRAFDRQALDDGLVDRLLDRARQAPSAGNTSAVGFVVLDSGQSVARYWNTTFSEEGRATFRWQQLFDAPVLVIVTTDPTDYVRRYSEGDKARTGLGEAASDWAVPYWWVDAGAVIQNMLLLADDAGLGACLFGLFDHEPAVCAEFGLDPDRRLVATIALGHPLPDTPGRSARRGRPAIHDIIVRP